MQLDERVAQLSDPREMVAEIARHLERDLRALWPTHPTTARRRLRVLERAQRAAARSQPARSIEQLQAAFEREWTEHLGRTVALGTGEMGSPQESRRIYGRVAQLGREIALAARESRDESMIALLEQTTLLRRLTASRVDFWLDLARTDAVEHRGTPLGRLRRQPRESWRGLSVVTEPGGPPPARPDWWHDDAPVRSAVRVNTLVAAPGAPQAVAAAWPRV